MQELTREDYSTFRKNKTNCGFAMQREHEKFIISFLRTLFIYRESEGKFHHIYEHEHKKARNKSEWK